MRILAVDDDPVTLDLLKLILRQADHGEISVATSGYSALKVLRDSESKFDCLIFDIEMPGMNGIELCKSVRSIVEYANTPIIMLTARSDAVFIESAFIAGANDYITKPFNVNDVAPRLEVAHRMINQRKKTDTFSPCLSTSAQRAGIHSFDISEPLSLSTASQLTDPFSLGNYLLQLARKRIENSLVFAVQVDHVDTHYHSCTSFEFATLLSEVSQAIYTVVENPRMLSAYMGHGMFMCICSEKILHLWPQIEGRIEHLLNGTEETRNSPLKPTIALTIGRPLRPNSSKTKRVGPTFDRAMAAVERRAQVKAAEKAAHREKLNAILGF